VLRRRAGDHLPVEVPVEVEEWGMDAGVDVKETLGAETKATLQAITIFPSDW